VAWQASNTWRISPDGIRNSAYPWSRAINRIAVPAERPNWPPRPGCISTQCTGVPVGISDNGNELPNAPHYTFNIGAQYSVFLEGGDWVLTFRGDYYRQGKSYARVFNTEYDRLKAWDNVNLAVNLARGEGDFALQLYVKNLFDKAPITGTFTNSDDTGLSTNVFTLDPRIVGLNATVKF